MILHAGWIDWTLNPKLQLRWLVGFALRGRVGCFQQELMLGLGLVNKLKVRRGRGLFKRRVVLLLPLLFLTHDAFANYSMKSLEIPIIKAELKIDLNQHLIDILGCAVGGQTPKTIFDDLNIPLTTIKNTHIPR